MGASIQVRPFSVSCFLYDMVKCSGIVILVRKVGGCAGCVVKLLP